MRDLVGADRWPQALRQLARFAANTNADCRAALAIIGDTVPRVKDQIDVVKLDGEAGEWAKCMRDPDLVTAHLGKSGRDVWTKGAAAVVRQGRLYLMAGLADPARYFSRPDGELRLTIDCRGDQAWDVRLSLSLVNGSWIVMGDSRAKDRPLSAVQGVTRGVAERSAAIQDFVPPADAKPIWALMDRSATMPGRRDSIRRGRCGCPGRLARKAGKTCCTSISTAGPCSTMPSKLASFAWVTGMRALGSSPSSSAASCRVPRLWHSRGTVSRPPRCGSGC